MGLGYKSRLFFFSRQSSFYFAFVSLSKNVETFEFLQHTHILNISVFQFVPDRPLLCTLLVDLHTNKFVYIKQFRWPSLFFLGRQLDASPSWVRVIQQIGCKVFLYKLNKSSCWPNWNLAILGCRKKPSGLPFRFLPS